MDEDDLPTRATPEGLHKICREIKSESLSLEEVSERLPQDTDYIQENADYGALLGFIDKSDDTISLTDRGIGLAYQDGISEESWPVFEAGVRESDVYRELTERVAEEAGNTDDISQTTVLRVLRLDFGLETDETELKTAVNTYLLTLEATGIGQFKLARSGHSTQLELVEGVELQDILDSEAEIRSLVEEAQRLSEDGDFPAFSDYDDELAARCLPQFRQGLYQEAVSSAFTVLEDRVRDEGGFTADDSGSSLMGDAFDKNSGPLVMGEVDGEKDGFKLLYMGAFQALRNPPHHRLLDDMDQQQARDLLGLVNLLLTFIENRS